MCFALNNPSTVPVTTHTELVLLQREVNIVFIQSSKNKKPITADINQCPSLTG